ncbi:MAG TPA: DUF3800 domain-containing protein [Candidatus Baltobacteraceae bacterium]|jgi:hypothetical protein|nr:DUF3800 domain-containing protein [Candidatus Baltobacteraceae bacterium]
MISPYRAQAEFIAWASLFSGQTFVKLVAYIDESGRHDKTGQQPGASQIVVAGIADHQEAWGYFTKKWCAILKHYDAPYFHFTEWVDAVHVARGTRNPTSSYCKNPYKGWKKEKLDGFLLQLGKLAGGGKRLLVGGFVSTRDFAEARKHPVYQNRAPLETDPYRHCLSLFFGTVMQEIQECWPNCTKPVTFFFDQNKDDESWNHAVLDAHRAAKDKDQRIAELSFANKKDRPHYPLQAADIVAYRFRQIAQNFTDPENSVVPSELDKVLIVPMFERANPHYLSEAAKSVLPMLPLRYANYPWRNKRGR